MSAVVVEHRPAQTVWKPTLRPVGRVLVCTVCWWSVDVIELPEQFLCPDTYTCGGCLEAAAAVTGGEGSSTAC